MIEGLKVTVPGLELRKLCSERAEFHRSRATVYESQVKSIIANEIDGMNYTNGDPKRALADKQAQHASEADEMAFIADHLNLNEEYLLDTEALRKLGICKSRY